MTNLTEGGREIVLMSLLKTKNQQKTHLENAFIQKMCLSFQNKLGWLHYTT